MNWISKNKKSILFSLLLNCCILLIVLLIFQPEYETNDDVGILCIVSGVKLGTDAHLVYINYILGKILAACYQICEGVPWYALFQYGALLTAFTAISYTCLNKVENNAVIFILLPILCAFSFEAYIKIQYTKTAGILVAAGWFLFGYAVISGKKFKRRLICSLALCALGFMYRNIQFCAETALMSAIGIPILSTCWESDKEEKRQIFMRGAAGCVLLFLLLAGLLVADKLAYRPEEWQDYLAYNKARTELYDYGFPEYQLNEETYEKLQIDKNAFKLYKQWNHGDTEKMSTEIMQSIASVKTQKKMDRKLVLEYIKLFPRKFFTIAVFYICLATFAYSILAGKYSKATIVALIYEAFMLMALYFYLYYQGRYLYNRVDVGIWLAASLVIIWNYQSKIRKNMLSIGMALAACALLVCGVKGEWSSRIRRNVTENNSAMRALIEEIHNDQEHLYITKMGTVSFAKAYGVFEVIPKGMADNLYPLGGWTAQTPVYTEVLDRYGVSNPFRDMIDNEKVYLVDKDIECTVQYLNTYYDTGAEAIELQKIGKTGIYQIK